MKLLEILRINTTLPKEFLLEKPLKDKNGKVGLEYSYY